MVEGWLLIVPRRHCLSIATLPQVDRRELISLVESLRALLTTEFGTHVVTFEHGASRVGQGVGCSVDHAHMHIVPTNLDLLSSARRFRHLDWHSSEGLLSLDEKAGDEPYLFLQEQSGMNWIGSGDIPSQLFRRIIAELRDDASSWNWRENPRLDTVAATQRRVSQALRGR
jgi:ATP adenylyltransferase